MVRLDSKQRDVTSVKIKNIDESKEVVTEAANEAFENIKADLITKLKEAINKFGQSFLDKINALFAGKREVISIF